MVFTCPPLRWPQKCTLKGKGKVLKTNGALLQKIARIYLKHAKLPYFCSLKNEQGGLFQFFPFPGPAKIKKQSDKPNLHSLQ